jgi:hypothetical protein
MTRRPMRPIKETGRLVEPEQRVSRLRRQLDELYELVFAYGIALPAAICYRGICYVKELTGEARETLSRLFK